MNRRAKNGCARSIYSGSRILSPANSDVTNSDVTKMTVFMAQSFLMNIELARLRFADKGLVSKNIGFVSIFRPSKDLE